MNKEIKLMKILEGEIIKAGDMNIDGESITGIVVEIPKDNLKENMLPFYAKVYIAEDSRYIPIPEEPVTEFKFDICLGDMKVFDVEFKSLTGKTFYASNVRKQFGEFLDKTYS
jgi:hypothetical protein